MDDSSDLEFDNLLENVKSTCKKKLRSKASNYDKGYQSCPPKSIKYWMNAGNSNSNFHDEEKCVTLHERNGLIIEDGRSANSAALKMKTPKLNARLLLPSSDDDDDDDFFEEKSGKVSFIKGNGIKASPKLLMRDNNEDGVSQTRHIIPDSPCQTPRQNLALHFNDDSPDEEVNTILESKSRSISKTLQNLFEVQDFERNHSSSIESTLSDDEDSMILYNFKTPKKNLKLMISSDDSSDDIHDLTIDDLPKEEVNAVLGNTSSSTSRVLQNLPEIHDFKRNRLSSVDKWPIRKDKEDSTSMYTFKTPKKKGAKENLNVVIRIDDSSDDIVELTDGIHRTMLKDVCEIKSTPRQLIVTSGEKSGALCSKASPSISDEENLNKSSRLLNKRPLNKGSLDCTYVASTPPANSRIHTPGLKDGYLSSTSHKKPKGSIKYLVSYLDDTLIEPDSALNSFQQRKENVTPNIPLDYSKPVSMSLYTKAGVNSFLAALSPESGVCNYDSKRFVVSFGVHKIALTNMLYYFFNKFVFDDQLPKNMKINWKSRLTSTAGICECRYLHDTSRRYCSINLSVKLLNSADKVRDTLIHELCHAAVYLINEESDNHGPFWRFWTKTANLAFPDLPLITRCHSYKAIKRR